MPRRAWNRGDEANTDQDRQQKTYGGSLAYEGQEHDWNPEKPRTQRARHNERAPLLPPIDGVEPYQLHRHAQERYRGNEADFPVSRAQSKRERGKKWPDKESVHRGRKNTVDDD